MARIKFLLFLLALAAQVPLASATVTYVVGTCKPSLPSFTTINEALGASPAPGVVEVCPGTYPEQVVITNPVTLEGISNGNSTQAIISPPSGGLAVNTTADSYAAAAQVLIQSVSGEVNLSNLTVDGSGNTFNSGSFYLIVGVAYNNSPGTMNHLTIQNQGGGGNGVGVWLEGGSANPSVTLENSNLQGFDSLGIAAAGDTTNPYTSDLTATMKGNYISVGAGGVTGVLACCLSTVSISGNLITGGTGALTGNIGILTGNGEAILEGSISKNTVIGATLGIESLNGGQPSMTSNTIYNNGTGITLASFVGLVTGNTIVQSGTAAIDFGCFSVDDDVHSNTILGAATGLANVPASVVTSDTYYNAGTIRSGGC
jgi:hypothetical protein